MASAALPKTMRGLVHNQKLQTLAFSKALPLPVPKGNEILLKVASTAITNGELDWPRPPELNESFPGTDMSGSVVSAPGSSKFKAGDRVYMRTEYPRAGSAREYSIGLEKELALRPKNIGAEEAAAVPVSALTAWQALFVHAAIPSPMDQSNGVANQKKLRILVNGASGAVGLWMVQLARIAGATVVGTCTSKNADLVRNMGAEEMIDYTQTSISEWAKQNEKVE
jgi:NADPH:quinone reductase-like Zn-dependent oxidoreductase